MRASTVRWAPIWIGALLSACETATQVTTPPPDVDPARLVDATILGVGGDDQEGAVATYLPLPLVVEVLDAGGVPIAGAPVQWLFAHGRGRPRTNANADSVVVVSTDASGRASIQWELGTRSGLQEAWALLVVPESGPSPAPDMGLAPKSDNGKKTGFHARGKAGAAAEIVLSHEQLELTVGEEVFITAVVVDRYGNVVEGAEVTFTSSDESVATVQAVAAPSPSSAIASFVRATPARVSAFELFPPAADRPVSDRSYTTSRGRYWPDGRPVAASGVDFF